jgi:3-oxoacyl-[acyl-carrier protein] reductase
VRDRVGTALVTGSGRGIGLAIARALTAAGFDVALASLEDAPDCDISLFRPGRAIYRRFDVARIDDHTSLLDDVEAELGELTCLVNNAGVTSLARGDLIDLSPQSFDRTISVNLRGDFFLTQAVARRMLARPRDPAKPQSIVTIGSANAESVGENRADYCMSKAALAMMSKLFAARLAEAAIAVYEIRPGIVRTSMTAPAAEKYDAFVDAGGVPMRRWGETDDVARTVVTLARGDIPYATGIHIDIASGMQLHRI